MFYNNAKCDGCGEPLLDGEDIVVCPECGTPQHRKCYELNNCCVNEHLHESGFNWHGQDVVPEEKSEPETQETSEGESNTEPVAVGIPMPALDVNPSFFISAGFDPETEFDGIKAKDAVSYTQIGAKGYVRKFIRSNGKKRFVSWNWGAFFFAPAWFFYRKLYKIGFIFLGIVVAMNLALYPQSQKIADVYPVMEEYLQEMKEAAADPTEENKALVEQQMTEMQELSYKTMPALMLIMLGTFLVPNTIAALIANSVYKRKMLEDIKKAKNISKDNGIVKYSILRSGGVALIPAAAALMVQNYLPAFILKIVSYFILK